MNLKIYARLTIDKVQKTNISLSVQREINATFLTCVN